MNKLELKFKIVDILTSIREALCFHKYEPDLSWYYRQSPDGKESTVTTYRFDVCNHCGKIKGNGILVDVETRPLVDEYWKRPIM